MSVAPALHHDHADGQADPRHAAAVGADAPGPQVPATGLRGAGLLAFSLAGFAEDAATERPADAPPNAHRIIAGLDVLTFYRPVRVDACHGSLLAGCDGGGLIEVSSAHEATLLKWGWAVDDDAQCWRFDC